MLQTNNPRSSFSRLLWLAMDISNENTQFISKYFPKCFLEVDFELHELQDAKTLRKIQHLKYVKRVKLRGFKVTNKNLLLKAFKNQKKNITSLDVPHQSLLALFPKISKFSVPVQELASWKYLTQFIKLTKLNLDFSGKNELDGSEVRLQRAIQYFNKRYWSSRRIKDIKSLCLSISNQYDGEFNHFWTKLSNSEDFLQSLQAFEISFTHLQTPILFSLPTNLFQFITVFKLNEVQCSFLNETTQNVSLFKNLLALQISKSFELPQDEALSVNYSFLRQVTTLTKLKVLDLTFLLDSPHVLTQFLTNFSLPVSLITIQLSFIGIPWKSLSPKTESNVFENSFFQSEDCLQFYTQWENLSMLQTFKLHFLDEEVSPISSVYVLSQILKRVQSLNTLSFSNLSNSKLSKKKHPVDFEQIWSSIFHLHRNLEKLYVDSFAISIKKFSYLQKFSNISLIELGLTGNIFGDLKFREISKLLEPKRSQAQKLIDLNKIVIDNDDSFLSILESFKSLPKHILFRLKFDVRRMSSNGFITNLSRIWPSLKRRSNLTVLFKNLCPVKTNSFAALCQILFNNPRLQNIIIQDQKGDELFNYEMAVALAENRTYQDLEASSNTSEEDYRIIQEIQDFSNEESFSNSASENEEDGFFPETLSEDLLEDFDEN